MTRRYTPQVVTANDLRLGDVIYLTADDRWTRLHHEAELIEDEAHAQMRLLHAAAQKLTIVGAYLANAKPGPNGPEPIHFREAFRTRGPSNYAHGKQVDHV
jgi:exonuclease III